jgi:hypothetical protein
VQESATTAKDVVLWVGVAVTFALGVGNLIYSYISSRRTSFINVVTAERIKWIQKVRSNVSELCATCDQWIWHRTQGNQAELQERIDRLSSEIRLQLNPNDPEDGDIERYLSSLPGWTNALTPEQYRDNKERLVAATQALLKKEWDKVKDEAKRGDLRGRKTGAKRVG